VLHVNEGRRYVLAFTAHDYGALALVMTGIVAIDRKIARTTLSSDLAWLYSPLIEKNLAEIKYEEVLPDITAMAFRYGIRLPSEFLLILKQLLFFDRYAKLMAPKLNVFSDWQLVHFLFGPPAVKSGLHLKVPWPLRRPEWVTAPFTCAWHACLTNWPSAAPVFFIVGGTTTCQVSLFYPSQPALLFIPGWIPRIFPNADGGLPAAHACLKLHYPPTPLHINLLPTRRPSDLPDAASRRRTSGVCSSCTKWNWMFWRVVRWPQPRE